MPTAAIQRPAMHTDTLDLSACCCEVVLVEPGLVAGPLPRRLLDRRVPEKLGHSNM